MAWFNDIDTTKKFPLGYRRTSAAGNEYVYVKGVSSGAQYAWVSMDEDYVTTLTAANVKGRVGILQSDLDATTKFGWALVYGKGYGKALASYADNAKVWVTSTAGSVDDADVAVDIVTNAIGRSAVDAAGNPSGTAIFELSYPFCHNEVLN